MAQDTVEPPKFEMPKSPDDFRKLAEELKGRGMSVLDAKDGAALERKDAIQYLKDTYNLNGQAENVIEDLELFHQEAEAKKEWSTWDYVKYPFKKTWEVVKAHPYLTAIAVTTAVGAGAYYTGALTPAIEAVKSWLVSLSIPGMDKAAETLGKGVEIGKEALTEVKDGAGELLKKVPTPDVPTPPVPTPPVIPDIPKTMPLDEAQKFLDGLDKLGS